MSDETFIIIVLVTINLIQFCLLVLFSVMHHVASLELVDRDIQEKYGLREPQQTLRELLKRVEELK